MKRTGNIFPNLALKKSLFALLLCMGFASRVFAQCSAQAIPSTISSNTTWSTGTLIDHDITVISGVTLTMTNATFTFIPNVKITVKYGGHLVLNNAILTKSCTNLWRGIVVIGDTTQVQNDAMSSIKIENGSQINYAKIGVLLGDSTDSAGGGAKFIMSQSSINNCREGVIFLSYPDSNISTFDSSRFTSTALLPGYDSSAVDVFVSLIRVHGIVIAGCSFIKTVNDTLLSKSGGGGTGISAKNAGYSIVSGSYHYCLISSGDLRQCCSGINDTIKGLGVGISNYNKSGKPKWNFLCTYTYFINNTCGVSDENSEHTYIGNCHFEIIDSFGLIYHHHYQSVPQIDPSQYPDLYLIDTIGISKVFGIFSNHCVGSDISDNVFYWNIIYAAFGAGNEIVMLNSGGSLSRIYRNTFGMDIQPQECAIQGYYANMFMGDNAGLSIQCNQYNVRPWDPNTNSEQPSVCSHITIGDWYITNWVSSYVPFVATNIYLPDQGSHGEGASNQFTNYNLYHKYNGNAKQSLGFGCGEYNIDISDANFNFTLTYYNYKNWTDTLGTIGNDLYPKVINTAAVVNKDTALYGNSCPASYCMNYLLAAIYTPPSPPTAPFFVFSNTGVKVYPNPTSDILNVQYNFDVDASNNDPAIRFQILDFSGKSIQATLLNQYQGNMELDTKSLAPGIYFYRFTDGNKNNILNSGKFTVSR